MNTKNFLFQLPLVTIFPSFCFSSFSTPWCQLQLLSSTGIQVLGRFNSSFLQQILLGNATILGVFDWWLVGETSKMFFGIFTLQNWGKKSPILAVEYFSDGRFNHQPVFDQTFLCPFFGGHLHRRSCRQLSSAGGRGHRFFVLFVCANQSATKTKVETNFAAHVDMVIGIRLPNHFQ